MKTTDVLIIGGSAAGSPDTDPGAHRHDVGGLAAGGGAARSGGQYLRYEKHAQWYQGGTHAGTPGRDRNYL